LTLESEGNGLFEDALKKNPKDEDFAQYLFEQMIFRGNIDGARKVISAGKTDLTVRLARF
jgi:hypothetical protein